MQRAFCFLLTIFSAATLSALDGIVWTLDGRKLEGAVELAHESLIVKSPLGNSVMLPMTNFARARFSTNATTLSKGSGNGLLGIYFNTTNFGGATVMRLDPTINFDWHEQSPMFGVPRDSFSVRWMGQIEAPTTDAYTIYFGSDDGGRIYLDEQLVVDHWARHDYAKTNVTVNLKAGEKHKLKLEYFNSIGMARVKLFWSTPTMPNMIVPQERLYAASSDAEHKAGSSGLVGAQGLLATYYNSGDFTSNSFTRIDPEINFDWQGDSPALGIDTNDFSVRWFGKLLVPKTDEYKFYILGGDSARFFINNQLLSDPLNPAAQQIISARLETGQPCELRLELRVTNNASPVRLYWSGSAFPQSVVSRQYLSPITTAPAEEPPPERGPAFPAGVFLLNGTIIAAPIQSANESSIRFQGVLAKQTLPLTKVARIYVKPLTDDLAAMLPKGRSGVLLKNGDFIDGDFVAIENGKLKLGTVLFGTRSYDFAKDVVAIVLRGNDPTPWRCSISARDGTVLYGNSISVEPPRMAMKAATEFSIAPSDLLEVACPSESRTKH